MVFIVVMIFQIKLEMYQKVSERLFPQILICFQDCIFQDTDTINTVKCEYSSIQVHKCKKSRLLFSTVYIMKYNQCSVSDKKSYCVTLRKRSPP